MGNAVKDFSQCFRPERPFLSAQAEGLGMQSIAEVALKGPFTEIRQHDGERPFQGQMPSLPTFPGLRPGLTETAFQAEKSFTALPFRACQL